MKHFFLNLFNFWNFDIQEKARISGTIGGLVTGEFLTIINVTELSSAVLITVTTTTISFFLPYFYKWAIKKTQITKQNFKPVNVSKHSRSTFIGFLILAVLVGLVYAGKAEFSDVAGIMILIVPFLLYGKKPATPAE